MNINLPGVVSFPVTFKKFDWFDAQVNSHKCFTKFDKQDGQRFRKLAANWIFVFKTSIWNRVIKMYLILSIKIKRLDI